MKRLSRTKGGKVLFFVGCVLFATLFAASLIVVLELFRWNAFTEPARAFWYLTHTDIPVLKVFTRIPWEHRFLVLGSCPLFLLAAVWCFVRLMAAAGRRPDTEELFPGLTARCPWEIVLAAAAAAGYLWYRTVQWLLRNLIPVEEIRNGLEFLIVTLGLTALGVFVCMDAAVRIKGKTFSDSSLTVRLYRKLPLIWKTLLAAGIVLFLQAFLWVSPWNADRHFPLVLILSSLAVLTAAVLAVRSAIMQSCLEKGGQALAAGDYEYRTETKGLTGAYKAHADNLNHIADGMEKAVEERLKSERMKSELITNVTHDLKTPLTSVVNYAALISEEPCENEKIKEYAGVLVRQADRLKHLIEDLTEAANASAGTTDVQLSPCDAGVLLMQAAGEYEERMQAAGLTLVTGQPETPLLILADSRRMWRIFDNLLNNICKYAQPGTRVYLQLSQCGNTVQTVFKNTSREPLNLSPDELLERFVRGDASRSTDGSGLGLSIAESLAKLQGGTLTLETDGDLFKATLTFPVYKQ